MNIGIIIWCVLSVLCMLLLIYTKIRRLKERVTHLGFRILANIATESIDEKRVEEKFKRLIKESLREYESDKKIKELGDGNSNS